jgi:hypothetical protein
MPEKGIAHAMLDLRALHPGPKPVFTPADLAELVGTFREVGFTQQERLAILYGSDPHHRARLFAFLSTMHGYAVRAFGDFEEALLWLSSGQETGPGRRRSLGEKSVPVRFPKRAAKAAKRPAPSRSKQRALISVKSKRR